MGGTIRSGDSLLEQRLSFSQSGRRQADDAYQRQVSQEVLPIVFLQNHVYFPSLVNTQ